MCVVLGFTKGQLLQLEDNTLEIEQREKEILSIVQSISDINEMYKDLATMIVEQVMIVTIIFSGFFLHTGIAKFLVD